MLLTVQNIVYPATDGAGNVGSAVRAINVADTLPPSLVLIGPNLFICEAASVYADPGCTATDLVDGVLTSSINVTGLPINTAITRNNTVTYSCCDRRSPPICASITRTVWVVQTALPVITLLGNATFYLQATFLFVDPGASVTDTLDLGLVAQVTAYTFLSGSVWTPVGALNSRIPGTYSLMYTVTNSHGLLAVPVYRKVIVQDTIPPALTLNGNATYYQQGNFTFVDPGCTSYDLLSGDLTSSIVMLGSVNINGGFMSVYNSTYSSTYPCRQCHARVS